MKVYLDDDREKRPTPKGWVRVYWPNEAIILLKTGRVEEISLDHDLGDDSRGVGYDVLTWLEREVSATDFKPPRINIHTENWSARPKMEAAAKKIREIYAAKQANN